MQATFKKHRLEFKNTSRTSRGLLIYKDSWFIILKKEGKIGIGECSVLDGLSPDDPEKIELLLRSLCEALVKGTELPDLTYWPAVRMGLESALFSLKSESTYSLFPSLFTKGKKQIPINGLVWMGDFKFMNAQIQDLIISGFDCIKLKIGAIDFEAELKLLDQIRKIYNEREITIRVDANGAFKPGEALEKLKRISDYQVHSIEQPIATMQWESMANLCRKSPLPIALDEELIGPYNSFEKQNLIDHIKPQYLIIKPTLLGGFSESEAWIDLAEKASVGWWITSALESNIGLNAIAQWTYQLGISIPQGLGTGSLFVNNISSPLFIKKGCLGIDNSLPWNSIL
tara:strand:- start:1168 stop:2196 length:1029 start_codon:yes stop_codon:yes gene_type:complete